MPLTLQSQRMDSVVVIQCGGRIVAGAEVVALQNELEKQTLIPGTNLLKVKWVVLDLAGVEYIDSSGLGALVRMLGVLRAAGGGLNLCHVSPIVLQVLHVTNLSAVLPAHASEREAVEAFSAPSAHEPINWSRTTIVCIDTSRDLLAYLGGLLTSSGYEVHTASNLTDGKRLVAAIKPKLVICGAGISTLPAGEEMVAGFHQRPNLQVLLLSSDFSTAEAGQTGVDLVKSVQSLLAD